MKCTLPGSFFICILGLKTASLGRCKFPRNLHVLDGRILIWRVYLFRGCGERRLPHRVVFSLDRAFPPQALTHSRGGWSFESRRKTPSLHTYLNIAHGNHDTSWPTGSLQVCGERRLSSRSFSTQPLPPLCRTFNSGGRSKDGAGLVRISCL